MCVCSDITFKWFYFILVLGLFTFELQNPVPFKWHSLCPTNPFSLDFNNISGECVCERVYSRILTECEAKKESSVQGTKSAGSSLWAKIALLLLAMCALVSALFCARNVFERVSEREEEKNEAKPAQVLLPYFAVRALLNAQDEDRKNI